MTHTNNDQGRVLAWETCQWDDEPSRATSALYCQTVDGAIYTTGPRLRTKEVRDNFAVKGDVWSPSDAVPNGAEFIGNYNKPANLPA